MTESHSTDSTVRGPSWFATTQWSIVLEAGTADTCRSVRALDELCRVYWFPIYAYVRRRGHPVHDAEDLTQGFFAQLLGRDFLANLSPAKGKFRAFLLASIKHYLTDERRRQSRLKRGGGQQVFSIDQLQAEQRYHLEPAEECTPDRIFDKHWVLTTLDAVLDDLRSEYEAAGKVGLFEGLKIVLTHGKGTVPFRELSRDLCMTEPSARMAASRLRKRYRELLRCRIAQTVAGPEEVEDELQHLFAALGN